MSGEKRTHDGLSVKTLLIAGVASATAAVVIPMLWEPGTVFAAAMTPIVVALVSESLRRPVETVSAVRVRRTPSGTALLDPPPPEPSEPFDPLAPPSAEELAVLPETATAPRAEHRRRPLSGRQWKLALVTGLVAFAAVAAIFTMTELIAGAPVTSDGGRTTFFGGASETRRDNRKQAGKQDERPAATKETATPEPQTTAEPTVTATPTPTPTTAPAASPTPAPAAAAPTP